MEFIKSLSLVAIAAIGVTSANFIPQPPESKLRELIAPPKHIKHMTFGYDENLADIFWLRALQDMDQCAADGLYHSTFRINEHGAAVSIPTSCDKGWLFRILDAVVTLAPNFHSVYVNGAIVLSVLVSDVEGARIIFDKGVEQFPKDWVLLYRAAYHYMSEVKNPTRAAELLRAAGANGAPHWTFSLASKLYDESGQLEFSKVAISEAIATYKGSPDDNYLLKLKEKLNEVNAKLEKARK